MKNILIKVLLGLVFGLYGGSVIYNLPENLQLPFATFTIIIVIFVCSE